MAAENITGRHDAARPLNVTEAMPETIYIVREFNVVAIPVEQADLVAPTTIWACVGNSDRYAETGTKIAGPIPVLFADLMIEGLRTLLEQLAHTVVVETTADD
jgi:hypothetical protein